MAELDARDFVIGGVTGAPGTPPVIADVHRLLLVDDDSETRELIAEALRADGYDVEEAGDGRDALAAILRTCPSLLITDCNMPNMTGNELVARLALDVHLCGIPTIMVSAAKQPLLPANVSAFLAKPFAIATLLATIRDCLWTPVA